MLKIIDVERDSVGEEVGLKSGDVVVSFDGKEAVDILDYSFYDSEEKFTLQVMTTNGGLEVEIEKEASESLGLTFDDDAYLTPKSCRNKCIFCFVDQLPKGMRESLYVKDDDYRLSFVSGNFVTLTNLSDKDISRIIEMRLSPLYISVHSLNEQVRREMLGIKNARPLLPLLKLFSDNNIKMHTQIVLCPGINDREVLRNTLRGLSELYPCVESVAIVPVGLTCHREGLPAIKPVDCNAAREVVDIVCAFNAEITNKGDEGNFAFCADELYLIADLPFPDYSSYGDFSQIENGVGLIPKFAKEFFESLQDVKKVRKKSFAIVTGISAEGFMCDIIETATEKFPDLDVEVVAVKNSFFGESVTVAGLITGRDIVNALPKGFADLIIPRVMLREFEDVFLDGMTVTELSELSKRKIIVCGTDGYDLAEILFLL